MSSTTYGVSGLDLVQPHAAETMWAVVGFVLLVLAAAALVRTAQRRQWGWFAACIAFMPFAPLLYFAVDTTHRRRQPHR